MTHNFEDETDKIISSFTGEELFKNIDEKARIGRNVEKNVTLNDGCLFGFINGRLYCGLKGATV